MELYLKSLQRELETGSAREHAYRPSLKVLIETIDKSVLAQNDPAQQSVGAPDFIITRKNIPIGFIEAKDIDKDLDDKDTQVQLKRYQALGNVILTNYLEFRFYSGEQELARVVLGTVKGKEINVATENIEHLQSLLKDFLQRKGETIKSSKKLAFLMAEKARLLKHYIYTALEQEDSQDTSLEDQYKAFKSILIHDLTHEQFADIYAQTIAYGLFGARFYDTTPQDFSRQEAQYLVPKSNPFLRKLFNYISGADLDSRIAWLVDSLAEIFNYTDIKFLIKNLEDKEGGQDPIIHFYETFLAEYDPKLRKGRGVYYTPAPVVRFIVRAVDDILQKEFKLEGGLSDTSKTQVPISIQGKKVKKEFHRVQILDPATGTGTFLNETIKQIYSKFEDKKGVWNQYVHEHLIPRLHGFELLMAPYTMAHLKLGITLSELDYKFQDNERLKVFLTNTLEEPKEEIGTLFASWLSEEAKEASKIKQETPVMVMIGNPPYAVSSRNKGEWITNLIDDYKKDLNEKKLNLDDDYVKFLRYSQHMIDKTGSGIVAMITNNNFLDAVTFRQMRKSLLGSFDKMYILNLHGDSKKKESHPMARRIKMCLIYDRVYQLIYLSRKQNPRN